MDIFEKLKAGIPVDMMSPEYRPVVENLVKTRRLCFEMNHTAPDDPKLRELTEEMLEQPLEEYTTILTPVEIDIGRNMKLAKHVFINHSMTCMSAGGISIEEGTQIGPQCTMVTTNHDFSNKNTLICKGIHICKNVWIGARVTIMPGVIIGENAVIAGGAVVTKDVEANTVVGGNPARVLKRLDKKQD